MKENEFLDIMLLKGVLLEKYEIWLRPRIIQAPIQDLHRSFRYFSGYLLKAKPYSFFEWDCLNCWWEQVEHLQGQYVQDEQKAIQQVRCQWQTQDQRPQQHQVHFRKLVGVVPQRKQYLAWCNLCILIGCRQGVYFLGLLFTNFLLVPKFYILCNEQILSDHELVAIYLMKFLPLFTSHQYSGSYNEVKFPHFRTF